MINQSMNPLIVYSIKFRFQLLIIRVIRRNPHTFIILLGVRNSKLNF